ncbi:CPBP family intramembrane glutamic endopeptidase [Pseudonocardia abyssalis]|uniref:CPBP family intramembrane metalloprotease n=1 Tax=Pseudonocardia abyssalis TaxID=2792008 RepID=A0ABS6UWP4_9PSEU|nr:CPBP family intramembrane glutamic endopeptidase [Pseudonocardia abyssalis]MBW0114693.1 CPBP family intramembrane metalloprotease [Pseudonocardia abyssalis]MBW0136688.1 CPBP family intramembrane metalloprotease [Pseudonocardia abyssalis]
MRVTPRPGTAILVAVAYIALVSAVWVVNGVDYSTIGGTVGSTVGGLVVPVALGAVLLAAVTTRLGWWRPVLREEPRVGPRWLLVVPVLFVLVAVGTVSGADLSRLSPAHVLLLAVGVLLVGFSEELLCRGIVLVGLRGTGSEVVAWLGSCLVFGLLHAVNALFGAPVGGTAVQVLAAFLAGSVFYVTRRVTGVLVACMVMHAFWDFGTLAAGAAPAADPSALGLLAVLQYPAVVLALVGVVLLVRRPVDRPAPRVA